MRNMRKVDLMAYRNDDLKLTFSPARGYWHFVLRVEPPDSPGGAFNARHIVEGVASPYVDEWLSRLESCEPDALHVSLVSDSDPSKLWEPCVFDDPDSSSAIGKDGCVCMQTFRDPVTWLPVVAEHFRAVGGEIESWKRYTYCPLALPEGERLDRLIIDRQTSMFWSRLESGTLYILPEAVGQGYNVGYGGGGPSALASLIERIVESDGYDASPIGLDRQSRTHANSWTSSAEADQGRELTLVQLEQVCVSGAPS